MLGAIIGDIVGSRFEFNNIRTKSFKLFETDGQSRPTDDSIMTLAIAEALLRHKEEGYLNDSSEAAMSKLSRRAVETMQRWGRNYPSAGYGGSFTFWLKEKNPQPYNSMGNGSAMRISPVGYAARTLEEARRWAAAVTCVSHNHPEGMKGAEATATAIFMARGGADMTELKLAMERYYSFDFTLDEIRGTYGFDATCPGSMPQALECFFESRDYEDAIRNAVSIGGDCDTTACIAGGIAGAYYGVPEEIRRQALEIMNEEQRAVLYRFENGFMGKMRTE